MAGYDSKSIRTASVSRKTGETDIQCTITLDHAPDAKQVIEINTGIGFLNHVSPHLDLPLYAERLHARG